MFGQNLGNKEIEELQRYHIKSLRKSGKYSEAYIKKIETEYRVSNWIRKEKKRNT